MMKPTVHDIARRAGVSLATVDRVLNARPGVRAKTVARVQAAISDLGYVRDLQAANLARGRQYRFAFVLPEATSSFLSALHAEVAEAAFRARAERVTVGTVEIPAFDPHAAARAVSGLKDIDGAAILAPDTPQVRDAVRHLRERGAVVVTLFSDLSDTGRDHFAGIDNRAAGRTAGVLMGRFIGPRAGSVAVIAGSMLARDHLERRLGFDEVMGARFPGLRVLPSLEARDDSDTLAALFPRLAGTWPDIAGVYCIGAGHRGLLRVLAETPWRERPVVIGHELSDSLRRGLDQGAIDAVINQDVGHVVRSALRVLRARADGTGIVTAQERIRIDIFLKENLQWS
ncbi:MAG: LacI family DNA-binding transcriptional regulator [Paracoccaceae bacterium]